MSQHQSRSKHSSKDLGQSEGSPSKGRPARVVRLRNIRGNIWANLTGDGQTVYNVTFDRLYREADEVNGQGEVTRRGEWKQSSSFGKDDLLELAKVADLAHTWVYQKIQNRNDSI